MKKHDELPTFQEDKILSLFNQMIKFAVKVLALLMVIVIFLGVIDVIYVLYKKLVAPPFLLLEISDILNAFAAFLAVLIAIEIYQNIVMYLRTDVIPVKLVVATALMAISRKVIILDFNDITPDYIYATAAVVIALGITYYLINLKYTHEKDDDNDATT